MNRINTTLGALDISELGHVDVHEHVVIKGSLINEIFPDFIHSDPEKISSDLVNWKNVGGGVIIDCSPIDAGRNVKALLKISQRSQVPIIIASGFHKREYYPDNHWVFHKSCEEIFNILFEELFYGTSDQISLDSIEDPLRIRAGVIKLAFDNRGIDYWSEKLLKACKPLLVEYQIPLTLHTEPGTPFIEITNWFIDNDIDPKKVCFCHMDKILDFSIHEQLTSKGFFIEYDSMVRKTFSLEFFSKMIKTLISKGLGNHLLFGGDLARKSYWTCYGGEPGLSFLLVEFTNRLIEQGFLLSEINEFWTKNPTIWLG